MKITSIKSHVLKYELEKELGYSQQYYKHRTAHLVEVQTDEGITGWGEPVLEAKALTVAACVDEMMDHIMGRDPMQIERHWQRMMKGGFYRGGPILNSAVAGIDQALWDITGKKLGVPVYQLLGGAVRDRVKIYGHVGAQVERDKFGKIPLKQKKCYKERMALELFLRFLLEITTLVVTINFKKLIVTAS